ncbi:sigma-54-dependent Fis family transcriptional regulator [Herbaspirillum sp. RTI4]|uniref:sigma-54-dependent Fis family transcriptional regulator n=1 Tax=Herbaspirillum sp. RTI4 TaxID=3048640 RepID=UPI002AB3FA58|nr:sigma-54-dependent Fis family transcriptional regulator [Herbaspirillum sp. RTI4]MDY7576887.1 sigma-54-dependent Fis family transcriptional regulator [Herbaspirillum sp. RTI4]MEA9982506.1 sigma-54-dependent Fis family transcriptional regulator [Herbaspirillum sp. RTI4]
MRHSNSALSLRHARQHLIDHGNTPAGAISDRLARSWERSVAAGVLPVGRLPAAEHSSDGELRQVLARNHELLAHSRPVMEYLFEQVRHSVVVLADNRGTLMHTMGDAHFLNKSERIALTTGASWHEERRGTNAIGTALAEESAIEIHGSEHFLERNGFLTCAAAPIMSSCGKLIGILDISGEQHSGHPHTLGLVNTAARMIENRLLIATCRRHIRLHLHAHAEGIGTVAEGIVALSDDGWIIGANRIGLSLLHLTTPQIGAAQLTNIMDLRLDDLLARHQRRPNQPMPVHLHDGTLLFIQVQTDNTVSALAGARSTLTEPSTDALAALDSGDLRWRGATDKARRILDKAIPLLIQGESGVGKEYFARASHDSSQRRNGPFVAINCAAIPENLIEAELFGYAPGAFTGAKKEGSPGRLREAHGGTLFLDEIGDMPLHMQTRLLRVLQERSVTPLGGSGSVPVDFALVCATHCKLREEADKGTFRSDLYYRINGLTVHLPALRERSDFRELTAKLLASLHPDRELQLAPAVLEKMRAHPWPGNLRQLSSVLRTACAMLDPDEDCIDWRHLPDDIAEELTAVPRAASAATQDAPQNLKELSYIAIQQVLESSRGNISLAARTLGISRQTLYRKMQA